MALAHLISRYGEEGALKLPLHAVREAGERNVRLIARLVEHKLNTPPTSSAGRLFDAVAALVGVPGSTRTTYEGQAAIELELIANGPTNRSYPVRLRHRADGWIVETREIIAAVVEDLLAGRSSAEMAATFHRTMAQIVATVCEKVKESDGVNTVALSGGTFQNTLLLDQTTALLKEKEFVVYTHRRVPANDGGLALGQAVLADRVFRRKAD
jgi:hydrogenase maturation protein HypF